MIISVCLNPSIDKTVRIPSFTYGSINRVSESREDAGGKGVNVALVARTLEADVVALGFAGREGFILAEQKMRNEGCRMEFHRVSGQVRTNLKIVDQSKNITTEVNEPGPMVQEADLLAMEAMVKEYASHASTVILTGSLPPGCPEDYYVTLMQAAKEGNPGIRCAVDAEGEKLKTAIEQKPHFIKPNDFELGTLLGKEFHGKEEMHRAALELVEKGVSVVLVSMGPEGALITDGAESYYAPALVVKVESTVGAGDAMVAAYCVAEERGLSLQERFVHAMAGGTAAVLTPGTQLVRLEDYQRLLPEVQAEAFTK